MSRRLTGSKFHSRGEETEKPLRPDRSFRNRGTRSWTWDDDRRLRLAGMSFTEWHSSTRYSGARPTIQFLVMELSLKWNGSQWRFRRIADEIWIVFANIKDQACSWVKDRLEAVKEVRTCSIEEAFGEIDAFVHMAWHKNCVYKLSV